MLLAQNLQTLTLRGGRQLRTVYLIGDEAAEYARLRHVVGLVFVAWGFQKIVFVSLCLMSL